MKNEHRQQSKRAHCQYKEEFTKLPKHIRDDVNKVDEPKAKALLKFQPR